MTTNNRFSGLRGNYNHGKGTCVRMKMVTWRFLIILAFTWVLTGCASLQERNYLQEYGSQGGRGQGFRSQPYQAGQEAHTCAPGKISGRITRLRVETFSSGLAPLLAADVNNPDFGLVHVHLGPLWFLEDHEADLQPGDEITFQGFCQTLAGRERLLATEVKHKNQTVQLVDSQGNSLWKAYREN